MADGNQLKMGGQIDVSDDDPFAELTRIMGFDPRQSVNQAETEKAVVAASPQRERDPQPAMDKASNDDDFSIDLEKELMGEFSAHEDDDFANLDFAEIDSSADAEPAAKAEAAEAASDSAELDFDFDAAIAASVAEDARAAPHAPADAGAAVARSVEMDMAEPDVAGGAHHDLDIAAELDAAMAADDFEMSDAFSSVEEPAGHEPFAALDSELEDAAVDSHAADAADFRLEASDLHLDAGDLHLDEADFVASSDEPDGDTAPAVAEDVRIDPVDLQFDADLSDGDSVAAGESDRHFGPTDDDAGEQEFTLDAADLDLDEGYVQSDGEAIYVEDEVHFDENDFAVDDGYAPEQAAASLEPRFPYGEAGFAAEPVPYEAEAVDPADADSAFAAYDAAGAIDVEAGPVVRSPMDEAAAEYRDRSQVPADLASAFNLEEELNALLGNRSGNKAHVEEPAYEPRQDDAVSSRVSNDLDWELEDLVEAVASAEHDADFAAEPRQDFSGDVGQETGFIRSFGPKDDVASAVDDLYAAAAVASAAHALPEASASPRTSMFSRSPAFSERYQQRADDSGADYRRAASPAWPSASPREAAHEDPLDVIAELTAKYSKPMPTDSSAMIGDDMQERYAEAPDVETIEVSDRAVALADDLDLPEFDFDDELPPVSAYDDLDTDFASLLNDMNDSEAMPADSSNGYADTAGAGYSRQDEPYRAIVSPAVARSGAASTIPGVHQHEQDRFALDPDDLPGSRAVAAGPYDDDYGYDPDLDDALAVPGMAAAHEEARPQRRGLLVAGIVGGVALIGALGAFALSFGGDGDPGTVAIVKVDDGPIKVKPENPGGTSVPNQDSKVYQTVTGEGSTTDPQQEKLVTTAEEPVDMAPVDEDIEDNPLVAAKSEDRIEQILQDAEGQSDAEIAAVAPRKVRTLVVRPDGTLVPREDTTDNDIQTDAVASAQGAIANAASAATGAVPEQADEGQPMAQLGDEQVAAVDPAATPRSSETPATAPIAPQRPAEQPIDVVGEVKPDQVASAATSAAGGAWSMQIASQPSEAAAQTSYKNLLARYGSVLNGREANIVKADVAGKGTFWRVRIPAASRNEAISLCETYKSAGGNCFVSK